MDENKTINTLFNATPPPSVDNAIKNLTDKPTANIGTTIADIWYIVFGWVSNIADKKRIKYAQSLEQFREELNNAVSQIPSEKQIEPSFQTTAQALENAKYCVEEKELRDMFTSLIANSMNTDFTKNVHPSFAEIIKQMSVIDAQIIKRFKAGPFSGIPICNYVISYELGGFTSLLENVFVELPQFGLDICSQSISSLVRLGLIQTSINLELNNPDYYKLFELHSWFYLLKKEFPNKKIDIQKGVASLTPLGRSFARVCIPD